MRGRILIVEDDAEMLAVLEAGLRRRDFDVRTSATGENAIVLHGEMDFDAVVTDLNMRGLSGIELCERIVLNRPDVPVLVITGFGSMDAAIASLRAGAYDFITKPVDIDQLAVAIDRAVQHRRLRDEVHRLRQAVVVATRLGRILGESAPMQKLFQTMGRAAVTDASILITGESGVGKELVARALHEISDRKEGPFVAVNCGAVPEPLLESELFGHRKGAFTDARSDRKGLFLHAHTGTLFLDEIASLPLPMQPKILRALQERRVRAVGDDGEAPFDARVIAATNSDIETEVAEGRFREDLFYRLNVINLPVPPLRSRGNDILLLAQHFIELFGERLGKQVRGISSAAAGKVSGYPWPGNVRELQNAMERAVALTEFEQITVDDLPEKVRLYTRRSVFLADDPAELVPLEEVERRYALRVLEAVQGNKTQAAQILGLDRKTLYRKLDRWLEEDSGAAR